MRYLVISLMVLVSAGVMEGMAMATVDPEVLERLRQAGGGPVPVLVVCDEQCDAVVQSLKAAGIPVSAESKDVGSVSSRVTSEQLTTIKSMPGVIAVEYDKEVKALGDR